MQKKNIGLSVGIIPWFRNSTTNQTYFLMGHPSDKPKDYWLYLRGMAEDFEKIQDTSIREFHEESGIDLSAYSDRMVYLGIIRQREGKSVAAYSIEVTPDMSDTIQPLLTENMYSNMCCGGTIPEIDDYKWMSFEDVVKYTNETNIRFFVDIVRKAKGS